MRAHLANELRQPELTGHSGRCVADTEFTWGRALGLLLGIFTTLNLVLFILECAVST